MEAISDGAGLLTWDKDSFAYADSYDETAGHYRGLRDNPRLHLTDINVGMVVKPEAARRQIEAEAAAAQGAEVRVLDLRRVPDNRVQVMAEHVRPDRNTSGPLPFPHPATQPKRFHGTVNLDPTRVGRDAGRIADEVISHLGGSRRRKGESHLGNRSRGPKWRSRQCRANGDRKQQDIEVHQSGIREGVEATYITIRKGVKND